MKSGAIPPSEVRAGAPSERSPQAASGTAANPIAGHTPGPWLYGDEDQGFDGVEYVQVHAGDYGHDTFRSVALVEAPFATDFLPLDDETRANARLIAAAPELLEACFKARHQLLKEGFLPEDPTVSAVNVAIAKATGAA